MSWTEFPIVPGARVVHLDAEGSDTNSGDSPQEPLRTLSAAQSRMRPGVPDRILAQRGDVFPCPSNLPSMGYRWTTSGESDERKQLLGSYGDSNLPRPKFLTDGRTGISIVGGGGVQRVEHVAIVGVEFDSGMRAASDPHGININLTSSDLLVEDVKIRGFLNGISARATGSVVLDLAVRYCVLHDSYSRFGAHAQGFYAKEVDGLLFEGNVTDNIGLEEPTIFRHGAYIQGDARRVTLRDNVFSRCSSHGWQMRSGGVSDRNVSFLCGIGGLFAGNGDATRNLFTSLTNIGNQPRRFALDVQNVSEGARIARNIMVHTAPQQGSRGIRIQELEYPSGVWNPSRNVLTEDNVFYGWSGSAYSVTQPPGVPPGAFHENLVEAPSNRWRPNGPDLVDPTMTLAAYSALVGGGGTVESLIGELLLQGRHRWREEYTAAAIVSTFQRAYARREAAEAA